MTVKKKAATKEGSTDLDDLLAKMQAEIQSLGVVAGINTDKLQGLYGQLVTALRKEDG